MCIRPRKEKDVGLKLVQDEQEFPQFAKQY